MKGLPPIKPFKGTIFEKQAETAALVEELQQPTLRNREFKPSKYQAPIQRIARVAIKNFPYNPRKITKHAAKRLDASLRKHGLVETLTWNERSGNLVGGHQRLALLDALEGSDGYSLEVSVVDLDPTEEAELCVQLNAPGLQGEFDPEAFKQLLAAVPGFDFDKAGFDPMDIELLFDGMEMPAASLVKPREEEAPAVKSTLDELEAINALKRRKKEYKGDAREEDDARIMVHLVFRNADEREAFLERIEAPLDRTDDYIDGARVMTYLVEG